MDKSFISKTQSGIICMLGQEFVKKDFWDKKTYV